jgi:hypothetical protein
MAILQKMPGRPFHPAIPLVNADLGKVSTVAPTPQQTTRVEQEIAARGKAVAESLVHRGKNEVLDVTGLIANPTGLAIQVLVGYTVPQGMVASIDKIAVVYSNSQVSMTNTLGWRLTVNGMRVDNIFNTTTWASGDYFYHSFSDLSTPQEISPLWVQSGETVAIELFSMPGPGLGALTEHLTMAGRLGGRLYKPATSQLSGEGY